MNTPKLITLYPSQTPPVNRWRPRLFKPVLIGGIIFAFGILASSAANYTMIASDPANNSSFNNAGEWSAGAAPAAGNTYETATYIMRSPANGSGYLTGGFLFGGDSLKIDSGGRLLGKTTVTLTNNSVSGNPGGLILNGGYIDVAGGNGNVMTLAGVITVNANSSLGGYGVSGNVETLNVQSSINGSTGLTLMIAGSINAGNDAGTVELSGSNSFAGTVYVATPTANSGTVYATSTGLLELDNSNALDNATLTNANPVTANAVTFAPGIGAFNVGALYSLGSIALVDTGGGAVTLSVGGNSASTTCLGALTDNGSGGSLVKVGAGTFTLGGANTYTGPTIVSNGTLALSPTALLTNSSSITVNNGATFDVSSNAFALASGQSLLGSGTNKGPVSVASGANIYAGLNHAYGTNTFTTNLTFSSGAAVYMDLGEVHNGNNDLIIVDGNLALNDTVFNLNAPGTSDSLDTSDYTLVTVSGAITGRPASTPTWNIQPVNSGHYTILTNGHNVVLHYNASLVPQGSISVSPNPAVRNQTVLVTVTVTFSATPISSVTLDATALGGSNNVPLFADHSNPGNYTNSVVIAPSAAAGSALIVAGMTDSSSPTPSSGTTPPFGVTVNVNSSETWTGGGANNNWSADSNWQSGFAPGYVGDSLTFAGTTRLAPNMDASYSIADLTFDSTAGSFVLGSSSGYELTLTDGDINNDSGYPQTLNLSITNAGNLIDFFGGNSVTNNAGISGLGGLENDNSAVVVLNGTNTFAGGILINSGTLQMAGAGLLGGTNANYAGNITNYGVLQYSSSATQTWSGVISDAGNVLIKDGSGPLILAGGNTYTGDTVISNGLLQVTGTLAGGNYAGNITDNGTLQWSSGSAQILSGPISGSGRLVKDGSGTLTLDGANTYGGATLVNGGTLAFDPTTYAYPTINSLVVNGGGTVVVKANGGGGLLPVGDLALNTNGVLNVNYDFSSGNPTAAAVDVLTNLSVSGTNILIRITGIGAAIGQFPVISYTGAPAANLNNFILVLPPGLTGNLVNNTANRTIDLKVTATYPATWIPLDAGDAGGTSSFTNSGNWANGNAPAPGYGYYTSTYLLRSPADTNSYTFGGSALSVDSYGFNATAGRFLLKGPGGATITVTNLIMDGGLMDYANVNSDNGVETLAGNITLIASPTSYIGALGLNSTTVEALLVTAPIGGTGNLQIGGANVNGGADIGVVALEGNNTYSGTTTVATGTLLADGTAPNTSVTVLTNATLGGTGSIGGALIVQSGGSISPGVTAQGALTNTIGTLTAGGAVSVSGSVVMKINPGASPNSDELVASSVTIGSGATFTVNNIGSTNLVAGDTFKLFSAPVIGSFSVTALPPLPGTNLFWTNNLVVNGTIAVVAVQTVSTLSTNITATLSGTTLTLSWPMNHLGWHLQVQTNSLSTGLGTNWLTIPGSDSATSMNITVNPANGAVFYRMVYP